MAAAIGPLIVQAQLINPVAPPPGGQTSRPITVSNLPQQKIGSFILGKTSGTCDPSDPNNRVGCARLCLNLQLTDYTTTQYGTSTNPTYCISSWTDLTGPINQKYLSLLPLPGGVTPNANGYVKIQGTTLAVNPYTLRLKNGSAINGNSALYVDGQTPDNFAGFLVGQVEVNTNGAANGRICLNSTNNYNTVTPTTDDLAGRYCIQNWVSGPNAIQPKLFTGRLTLNPVAAMVDQIGTLALTRGLRAGGFTLGEPIGLPVAWTCGDGICSAGNGETLTAGANQCLADCGTVTGLSAGAVVAASNPFWVTVNVATGTADQTGPNGTFLVVRSDRPNFQFEPVDHMIYPTGTNSAYTVVYNAVRAVGGTLTVNDAFPGLIKGHTYYYRAYRGSANPRYSPNSSSTSVFFDGSSTGGGSGGDYEPPEPHVFYK